MTAYDGRGIIEFSYCAFDETKCKMVDPEVERECDNFSVEEKVLEVHHAS